jgi:hypothetical protein
MTADLTTLFLREIDALRREVELYPTDESVWQPVTGLPNTGGTLVLHLVGNLRSFIGASIGGTGFVRNRDAEFSTRDITRADLSAMIAVTRSDVEAGLGKLSPAVLASTFPVAVGGRSMTTQVFVMHLLSHLAYHLGQIDYHRRAATGDARSASTLPIAPLGVAIN